MEGKKFIPTIKAIRSIPGVAEAGGIYKLHEMKSLFPYIDFNNTDYFAKMYTNDLFKIGDNVRYTGKPVKQFGGIKNNKVYIVVDVSHKVVGDLLYTSYSVKAKDSNLSKELHLVKENELDYAESKWIISFTNESNQEHPAVHELDYFAWKDSIKNTWKNIFVFDSKEMATNVAKMFAENSIDEIYQTMLNKPTPASAW